MPELLPEIATLRIGWYHAADQAYVGKSLMAVENSSELSSMNCYREKDE